MAKRFMAFSTSDPLVNLPSDTTFLLVGYDEQEPSRIDVMHILCDMDIKVLISPEDAVTSGSALDVGAD